MLERPLIFLLSDGPYLHFPGLAFSGHCEISSINSEVLLQFQLPKPFQMSWKCACAHTIKHASARYPTIHFTSGRKIQYILQSVDVQISRLTSYSLNQGCPDLVPGGHDPAGLDHVSTCVHHFSWWKHFFLVEQESPLDCGAQRLGLNSSLQGSTLCFRAVWMLSKVMFDIIPCRNAREAVTPFECAA